MSIRLNGFPFDSQITGYGPDGLPEYDRASNSEEFASLLHGFWRDGVFGTSALTVLAGSGLTATVGTGSILIQGRVARVTTAKTLTFDTANSQPRFDRVVARCDLSNAVRDIVLDIVKGTPASSPVAPALTRNQSKWELCLATVRIPAGAISVQQSNITDTRLDSDLCGLVVATMTDVDTTAFYNQIHSDLQSFKANEKEGFLEWFDSIRDILDENVAANLYDMIDNLTAEDVGARPDDWMPTAEDIGVHPTQTRVLLWNNASPSSQFAPQTISLDLTNYGGVIVEFAYATNNLSIIAFQTAYKRDTVRTCLSIALTRNEMRYVTVSNSGCVFSTGYMIYPYDTAVEDNTKIIPLKIYGIEWSKI